MEEGSFVVGQHIKKQHFFYALLYVFLGCIVVLTPLQASALTTSGIGGRPAHPNPNEPRTQSIFIYRLEKGVVKDDQVLVTNQTEETQTIDVYAVDGVVTNTGAYTCEQRAEKTDTMGAWLKLSQNSVTLEAGQEELVDFRLTMPANADVGEHNGCIVFEGKKASEQAGSGVQIQTRQALRVVAIVPGELRRDISIERFDVESSDRKQDFTLVTKNVGNVSADVNMRVSMEDIFGNTRYEDGGEYPVLSNQELVQTFSHMNRPLFGGWFNVRASITYNSRAGTFGTTDVANLTTKYSDTRTIFLWPSVGGWAVIIASVVLVAGLLAWWIYYHRRMRRKISSWQRMKVMRDSTIEVLAAHYGVSWKELARINKIAAPYTVKQGDVLLLPPKKPAR